MRTPQRLLTYFALVYFMLTGCMKAELTSVEKEGQEYFRQARDFLQQKKAGISLYNARKLDGLINNLSVENTTLIVCAGTELILCDLKTYRNPHNSKYSFTYYKASFRMNNGKIRGAYIYTIHTSLPKEKVDSDIVNILLLKSPQFTGEIITNAINDHFLFASSNENGKLFNKKKLATKVPNAGNGRTECFAYYLVTTTYYADGHTEERWDYLFTVCNTYCGVSGEPIDFKQDCPPDGGGGGGGGGGEPSVEDRMEEEVITEYREETDTGDDNAAPSGGTYQRIKYTYHASKFFTSSGRLSNVVVDNIRADPMKSEFIDSYGWMGERSLTLFGHFNTWTELTPPLAFISWTCFVHGRYVTVDGRIWTRQWNKAYSATR